MREEERTRVAREIHDVLAQELTRLKIDLVWLHGRLTRIDKPTALETLVDRVVEMKDMADSSIRSVQGIAATLRPAVLDSLGLCAAIEWLAQDVQEHTELKCRVHLPEEEVPVEKEVSTATFRIVQESITNVLRHAEATEAHIRLRFEAGKIRLEITDNGRGLPPDKLADPLSLGLVGMRERALLLGGQFDIRSEPGQGTTVAVRLPATQPDSPHRDAP